MKVNNLVFSNLNSSPVFLVGKKKRKQCILKKTLNKISLQCHIINWEEVNFGDEGVYILFTPPGNTNEKNLFKKLIETNNYTIILFKKIPIILNNNKRILSLPSMNNIKILKEIILFALSTKNQSSKLQKFRKELQNRNKEWTDELSLANELQKSLLPRDILTNLPINFAHKYLPHAYIGGDFYDIIKFNTNKIGIIIADVSGHGAAAAFITAMFKSILNHCAPDESSPARLLSRLNEKFQNNIQEHYITTFYSIIDIETMECTYCNAGHPRQLLIHPDGTIEELKTNGLFIGMFQNIVLEERTIQLSPGDRIVFYTDGVTDAKNEKDENFGLQKLKKYIKKGKHKDITYLSNYIINKIIFHMKDNRFPDDLTLLIAEIIEDI